MENVVREVSDHAAPITLLLESYADSYRGSSPKVQRRYRKLIAALEKVAERTLIR